MIIVTRLDGRHFAVNPDLIERIFESPDTTLIMADGARFIVTETMAEVIEKIAHFRARVISIAYNDDADGHASHTSPRLSIIHPTGPTGGTTTGGH
ncbi:flagellar FlbD family protein [Arthrobacter sp. GMC3]|uniref:flagellar FlbD family protein n=1 Tax=Arthrobacter sp. GMC3 TaxID=2058894 RepID=UPI000CE540F7|nr:flagellar FlbD family protein [Arthrobacter sp. GMC3]